MRPRMAGKLLGMRSLLARVPKLIACLALLLEAGCTLTVRRTEDESAAGNAPGPSGAGATALQRKALRVGNVKTVPAGAHFVLVEGTLLPADRATLEVRRGGSVVAQLRAGRERRNHLFAAEISAGEPRPGDEVFILPGAGDRPVVPLAQLPPAERTPDPAGEARPLLLYPPLVRTGEPH